VATPAAARAEAMFVKYTGGRKNIMAREQYKYRTAPFCQEYQTPLTVAAVGTPITHYNMNLVHIFGSIFQNSTGAVNLIGTDPDTSMTNSNAGFQFITLDAVHISIFPKTGGVVSRSTTFSLGGTGTVNNGLFQSALYGIPSNSEHFVKHGIYDVAMTCESKATATISASTFQDMRNVHRWDTEQGFDLLIPLQGFMKSAFPTDVEIDIDGDIVALGQGRCPKGWFRSNVDFFGTSMQNPTTKYGLYVINQLNMVNWIIYANYLNDVGNLLDYRVRIFGRGKNLDVNLETVS